MNGKKFWEQRIPFIYGLLAQILLIIISIPVYIILTQEIENKFYLNCFFGTILFLLVFVFLMVHLRDKKSDQTMETIFYKLTDLIEGKDQDTGSHSRRVAKYSELLGKLSGLSRSKSRLLALAAPLHDIGKITIPDKILNKPYRLTAEEFDIMKTHPEKGGEFFNGLDGEFICIAKKVAMEHHENFHHELEEINDNNKKIREENEIDLKIKEIKALVLKLENKKIVLDEISDDIVDQIILYNKEIESLNVSNGYEYTSRAGAGYPNKLKNKLSKKNKNGISIYGRITAIADVFDALSMKRIYKEPWSDSKIIEYFQAESGLKFDPILVKLFIDNFDEFKKIRTDDRNEVL